jgi:[ribosomal protein S18]-alanine N-acetyltransferase
MARQPNARRTEIGPMRPADLDEVMEIERLAFRNPWSRQIFIEELERSWAHLEVVRDGPRVAAFCNYWLVRDEVHLLNIAVHPDARHHGHAARLMAHIIEFGRRHRCRYVTLEVRRSNRGAVKLYRSFGFRPVGIRAHYYVEDGEDAIVMLLDL